MAEYVYGFTTDLSVLKSVSSKFIVSIFKKRGYTLSQTNIAKIEATIRKSNANIDEVIMGENGVAHTILDVFGARVMKDEFSHNNLDKTKRLRSAIANASAIIEDKDAATVKIRFGDIEFLDKETMIDGYGLGYWRYFEYGAGARTLNYSEQRGGAAPGYRFIPDYLLRGERSVSRLPGNGISEGIMVPTGDPEKYHRGVRPSKPIKTTADRIEKEWRNLTVLAVQQAVKKAFKS